MRAAPRAPAWGRPPLPPAGGAHPPSFSKLSQDHCKPGNPYRASVTATSIYLATAAIPAQGPNRHPPRVETGGDRGRRDDDDDDFDYDYDYDYDE
ncbi:hypothetical protein GGTG_02863 [Gaeumannomyces tritici R3-111a-1]|uniref:Uncharacterized protein n=1 Tax=Gaeumannomyces tritici (strain R3-111a-1) TaxID=644352 RepID=J3NNK6_GAET3|nr:hypothetical protein GGTG_02863 [Gaeumannomyces tritici R3-111a-1]EJT77758.1 hypothetical protein GGTG_02863 [Gaeumannomyces tritici R3-111a-1]